MFRFTVVVLLLSFTSISTMASELKGFQEESKRASTLLQCKNQAFSSEEAGSGKLFGCVEGKSQTVKFFINEAKGTGKVDSIKLMWNDWTVDAGFGIHSDKVKAQEFIKNVAKLYVPDLEVKLQKIFFSNSDTSIDNKYFIINYQYYKGPKIDERVLILKPKQENIQYKSNSKAVNSDFDKCKIVISKIMNYSLSNLSGDGEKLQELDYVSYMFTSKEKNKQGRSKDLFFCEVHPKGIYKIKAAVNRDFPMKYIAEGSF